MIERPIMPDSINYRIPRQRISLVRDGSLRSSWKIFCNSRQVFEFAREQLYADADTERFHILMLDSKNRLIGVNMVSQGSINTSIVVPMSVFKAAIIANSPAIICTHNHPSHDPAPSREDRDCTSRLVQAGTILGIRVLDHIICGLEEYYSFADSGVLTDSLP
jgi:DNA repair protein RadC